MFRALAGASEGGFFFIIFFIRDSGRELQDELGRGHVRWDFIAHSKSLFCSASPWEDIE